MRRIKIGGSDSMIVGVCFMWAFVAIIFFIMVAIYSNYSYSSYNSSLKFAVVPLFSFIEAPFLAIAISLTVRAKILNGRKNYALQGRKAKAEIKYVEPVITKGTITGYKVNYYYKSETNEDILGETIIKKDDKRYFEVGYIIPIYVNDDCGYFRIEEVKTARQTKSYQNTASINIDSDLGLDKIITSFFGRPTQTVKTEEKFFVCPYCDSRVNDSYNRCPNCGARREN